jgi:hypothetical protein
MVVPIPTAFPETAASNGLERLWIAPRKFITGEPSSSGGVFKKSKRSFPAVKCWEELVIRTARTPKSPFASMIAFARV